MAIFANQDLVQDPLFSNIDLVSCRNVIISFNRALQRRVLTLLHSSLKPNGLLFLGPSENVGDLPARAGSVQRQEMSMPGATCRRVIQLEPCVWRLRPLTQSSRATLEYRYGPICLRRKVKCVFKVSLANLKACVIQIRLPK